MIHLWYGFIGKFPESENERQEFANMYFSLLEGIKCLY